MIFNLAYCPLFWGCPEPVIIYYKIEIQTNKIKIVGESEIFENILQCDFIELDIKSFDELISQNYHFPDNPIDGHIDASIYYQTIHHPVYISKIEFGKIVKNKIIAKLTIQILFEYEGSTFLNTEVVKNSIYLELGNLTLDRENLIDKYKIKEVKNLISSNISLKQFKYPVLKKSKSWISSTTKKEYKIITFEKK